MRRIAIIASCMTAVLGIAQPAVASDSTLLVKGLRIDSSTTAWPSLSQIPCGGTSVTSTYTGDTFDIVGSSSVPLDPNLPAATRSWKFGFHTAPTESDAYGAVIDAGSAADLATFKIDVNGSNSGQASIYAWWQDHFWVGKAALTTTGTGWQTVDASNLTYTWYGYAYPSSPGGTPISYGDPPEVYTYSDFEKTVERNNYPSSVSAVIGFGCDNKPFAFQNLQAGPTGSVVTYDFSSIADQLQIGRSASKIVAGRSVHITGGSKFGSFVHTLHLQARPATSSKWTAIANAPVGAQKCVFSGQVSPYTLTCWNPVSAQATPRVSTYYRWVENGSDATDYTTSGTTLVSVATRLTATWPSIHRNHTFAVTGATYPAKPGSVVTLWGKRGTTKHALGHATVSRTGTFRVRGTARASGSWSFWITIPAGTGNTAGTSAFKHISLP